MPPDLLALSCVIETVLLLVLVATSILSRRAAAVRQSLDAIRETTKGTRPQWTAIISAIIGANAGYIILIGSYVLITAPQDPVDSPGFWMIAAVVAYLMCGIPVYLVLGAVVGLLVSRYVSRNSLPDSAAILMSLAGSAATGALLAIPIYFFGLMGAAL